MHHAVNRANMVDASTFQNNATIMPEKNSMIIVGTVSRGTVAVADASFIDTGIY
jgi:hypothetical protein